MEPTSSVGVLKDVNDLENFQREIPYSFLQKKAEKLTTAVYLVTGFLSDSEPIKWQIRECALRTLSDVISFSDLHVSEMTHHVKSNIEKITALFEIAAMAGFLSKMNLSILKDEYLSLARVVEGRKIGKAEGGYVFSREFFSTPVPVVADKKTDFVPGDFYKGHFKKEVSTPHDENKRHLTEIATPEGQNSHGISDTVSKSLSTKKFEKSSRGDIILRLIKDKGDHTELSIKDIVGRIPDCGEKTVQRELTALVEKGVLKKTGERRWSRYSLNVVA